MKVKKTNDAKKGGLFVGDSHAEGGIPAIVIDTGQPIEVEGGEVIINKEASKKYWKELSAINQSAGNGVPIPPPAEFSSDVSRYSKGGKVSLSALKEGTKHELEHAETIKEYMREGFTVEEVAKSIAKDHLQENPNYYKILNKLKFAKGGEVVCRSCGNHWHIHQKDVGMNVYECSSCGNHNSQFYKKQQPEKNNEIVCKTCGWHWLESEGGSDKYVCHKCNADNSKFYKPLKAGKGLPIMSLLQNDPETGMTGFQEMQSLQQQPFNLRGKADFIKTHPEILMLENGGLLPPEKQELYREWKNLVNMSVSELKAFYDSKEGKEAGLSAAQAREQGIDRGRTSARWIMKMLDTDVSKWTPAMWKWCKKQISFIKRMRGNKGSLYDEKGVKTPKHTSLLIWGHNPERFDNGGKVDANDYDRVLKHLKKIEVEGFRPNAKPSVSDYLSVYSSPERITYFAYQDEYYSAFTDDILNAVSVKDVISKSQFKGKLSDHFNLEDWEDDDEYDDDESDNFWQKYNKGGRTLAQTPAPKKDRIYGSKVNPKGSAKDAESAKSIQFDESTTNALKSKMSEFNTDHPDKKVTLDTLKAVMRRGLGAYSVSHRPTISGGKPNARVAWGLARVDAFLRKKGGGKTKKAYVQDDDLLFAKKGMKIPKGNKNGDCYETAGKFALNEIKGLKGHDFVGTPYVVHAEVEGQGAISGIRYGHAWVEDDVMVYDFSNGREIIFPKVLYYHLGKVIQEQPKYFKYTFEEATRKMLDTGHYGSWELITESGL